MTKKKNSKQKSMRPEARTGLLALLFGSTTNTDKSKKAHEEKVKRQQKARAHAKDIPSMIGYDALYRNGIAQVEEGLFSQTVEFTDISYQSARKENQQNIFTVLCSLYNYFGADSCLQLTIANVPIPDAEIGRKTFFPETGPDTQSYAHEYNGILNDKMRGRRVQPHAPSLPHIHGRGRRYRRGDTKALAHQKRRDRHALAHQMRCACARRHRTPSRYPIPASPARPLHVHVGQGEPDLEYEDKGPDRARPHRLQARWQSRHLPHR